MGRELESTYRSFPSCFIVYASPEVYSGTARRVTLNSRNGSKELYVTMWLADPLRVVRRAMRGDEFVLYRHTLSFVLLMTCFVPCTILVLS
ncbi:unnamed protein product [Victoria cruziana]